MSITPQDIAVSFRSFARRFREVVAEADPAAADQLSGSIDALVTDAARHLHCPADSTAVADAVEAIDNDGWTDERLASLHRIAMAIGAQLRDVEDSLRSDD
jgi:hypothetical protein